MSAFLFFSLRLCRTVDIIKIKIYRTIDRRASSFKQNLPLHRRADSTDHTSRSLTCTVTTRPNPRQSTTSSLATVVRLRTWSRRHGSQELQPAYAVDHLRVRRTVRGRRRASSDRHVAIFVSSNIPNRQSDDLPLTPPPVEEV